VGSGAFVAPLALEDSVGEPSLFEGVGSTLKAWSMESRTSISQILSMRSSFIRHLMFWLFIRMKKRENTRENKKLTLKTMLKRDGNPSASAMPMKQCHSVVLSIQQSTTISLSLSIVQQLSIIVTLELFSKL
jgi:hypothetical protein